RRGGWVEQASSRNPPRGAGEDRTGGKPPRARRPPAQRAYPEGPGAATNEIAERTTDDRLAEGGGQDGGAAPRAMREHGADGSIGILSSDEDAPYTRPALTKKLWIDPEFGEDAVPLNTVEDTGAEIRVRTVVTAIDREAKQVELEGGERIGY